MSGVFIWLFGAITGAVAGFVGGIALMVFTIMEDPEYFIHVCSKHPKE